MHSRNTERHQNSGVERKWLAVKYGLEVLKIVDDRSIEDLFFHFRDILNELIVLAERPVHILFSESISEVFNFLNEVLPGVHSSIPLLLLVDDAESSDVSIHTELANSFQDYSYIFKITGTETREMLVTRNFLEFRNWSREFVENIMIDNIRGPHSELNNGTGKLVDRETLYVNYQEEEEPDESPEQMEVVGIENVLNALNAYRRDDHERFVRNIAIDKFFRRMRLMFDNIDDNSRLLQLIRVSLTPSMEIGPRIAAIIEEIILKALDLQFIPRMCDQIYEQFDRANKELLWSVLEDLMEMFMAIKKFALYNWEKEIQSQWDIFFNFINHIPKWFWNEIPENLVNWLRNKVDEFTVDESKQRKPEPQNFPKIEKICLSSTQSVFPHPVLSETSKQCDNYWEYCEQEEPPCDFRNLSEIPQKEDIIAEDPPYVRRAVVDKKYENSQHYLDVMFRLLREDLISPLRDGIHLHKTTSSSESSINIYDVLEVRGVQVKFNDGIEFRYLVVTNNTADLKSLLYGQIICLSCDDFKSDFHMGCVVERKENMCSTYTIGVQFYESFEKDEYKSYRLAEPSSYFEAYQHVLKAIKKINRLTSFPMERYLVYCKNSVLKPLYMRLDVDPGNDLDDDIIEHYEELRKHEKDKVFIGENAKKEDRIKFLLDNVHPIFPNRTKTANEDSRDKITIYGAAYSIDTLRQNFVTTLLNPNQREALIEALTNELCLIQGPPGTGKTFIGVEIVRVLVANRIRFGILKPVLLVCYTNAALDQFLEKVYKMLSEDKENGLLQHNGPLAVRLGSKSESDLVEKMRLSRTAIVNDFKNIFAENENVKFGRVMRDKRNQAKELSMISSILRLHTTKILRFEVIRPAMSSSHSAEFIKFHSESCPKLLVDEAFGHWLLDKPIVDNRHLGASKVTDGQDFGEAKSFFDGKEELEEADITLAELFRRMNFDTRSTEDVEEGTSEASQLETTMVWDLTSQVKLCDNDVILFGKVSTNGYNTVVYDSQIETAVFDNEPQILKTSALSESEAYNIDSILTITRARRWELYNYWIRTLKSRVLSNITQEIQKYQVLCKDAQLHQQAVDAAVLKNSLIVGATTTGAAKFNDLLSKIGSKVVIIEEAAEVLEGHCFASIPSKTEHLIMIGDHKQLRPNPSVYELGKIYNLNVSMFERLIMNGFPHVCLSMQHRMLPLLTSTIIRPYFYENLEDHMSVKEYPEVAGMEKPLYFWSHEQSETILRTSYTNRYELLMISKLVRYLLLQQCYKPSDISVLTPYSEQQSLLDSELNALSVSMGFAEKAVGVHTVDSFQGKENKIILLSLVRSNGEGIGFLSISNRVCVALTRAKHGMYVVGNIHYLKSRSALWQKITMNLIDNELVEFFLPLKCQVHGNITEIYEPEDFDSLAADGGCEEKCGFPLECGHFCNKRCHVGTDHLDDGVCRQPCLRVCSNEKYKHKCQNICKEVCGGCYQLEYLRLACGHEVGGACQDLHKLKCRERCPKFLECGHQCSQNCGEECTKDCLELMPFKQDCNHIAEYLCSNPEVGKCTFPCEKVLICGHKCPNDCSNPCARECLTPVQKLLPCGHRTNVPCAINPEVYPCPVEIEHYMVTCGHYIKSACSSQLDTLSCPSRCMNSLECGHICIRQCGVCREEGSHSCGEICRKNLACGHQCMDRCGVPCGPCKADCLTSCSHQACGSPTIRTKTGICYGRQCSEICVLCSRACDNHCEHRFCQLRCFEVCDVKPCENLCSKKLACGHVCLGMCSEVCPSVCGTCNQKKYVDIVSAVKESNSKPKIHRLIMIPFCNHIFPVPFLDNVMSNFKQKVLYPRCPQSGCGQAILGVQRYSRIIKEIVFKRYQLNEKRRVSENAALKHYNFEKYKAELKQYFKSIDCLAVQSKAGRTRIKNLQKLREKWVGNHSVDFLYDLSRSLKSLVYLFDLYFRIETKLPRRNSTFSPNMERICSYISKTGNIKTDMENFLDDACAWFNTNMTVGISGVFVPVAKEFLMRAAVNLTICELVVTNLPSCTDIDESKMSRLSALLARVNETGSTFQLGDLLRKILAFINESKLINEKDFEEWKLFLSFPFPEF